MSIFSDIALSQMHASASFMKQQAQVSAEVANIVKESAENAQAIVDKNQVEKSTKLVDIVI